MNSEQLTMKRDRGAGIGEWDCCSLANRENNTTSLQTKTPIPFPLTTIPLLFIVICYLLFISCSIAGDLDQYKYKPKEPTETKTVFFTVCFEAKGGLPAPPDQAVESGGKALPPEAVLKEGYVFGGWHKDEGCEYRWNFDEDTVGADIVLYAKWNAISYTVAYNANGGGGIMFDSVHVYDEEKPLRKNAFARDGYAFAGWAKTQTGAVEFADEAPVANLSSTEGDSIELYAQWGAHPYYVAYNANGGSGTMENSKFFYGVSQYLNECAFARTGYTFAGWAETEQGAVQFPDGGIAENLSFISEAVVTLYAQWDPIAYTVHYDENAADASGTTEDSVHIYDIERELTSSRFNRIGFVFMGWNTETDGSGSAYFDKEPVVNLSETSGDLITLHAQWGYTATFNANGGLPAPLMQAAATGGKIAEPAPMSNGSLVFDGWYRNSAFTVKWDFDTDTLDRDRTLYAKWGYAVTFEANGGLPEPVQNPQIVISGGKVSAPVLMGNGNLSFGGWHKDSAFNEEWNFGTDTVNAHITLYAKWGYTVTFINNGGLPVPPAQIAVNGGKIAEPAPFTRTGYAFDGWYRIAFTPPQWNFGTDTVNDHILLYAKWNPISYTVRYHANGGSGTMADSVHVYDVPGPLNPLSFDDPPGFKFSNWLTEDGIEDFQDEETVLNLSSVDGETVHLYAQWGENPYYISYNANGGSGNMAATTFYFGITQRLRQNTFTHNDYEFAGWALTPNGPKKFEDRETVSDADFPGTLTGGTVTLYAKWGNALNFDVLSMNNFTQTDEGEGRFETQTISKSEGAKTIQIEGVSNVTWHLGLVQLGTGNSLTLNPAAYNTGTYTITVTFTYNSKPWLASLDLIIME